MRRNAETLLAILRPRGPRGLPVTEAYRRRSQRARSLRADGTRYRHQGAMPPGSTADPVAGLSLEQIDARIDARRHERYRGTPGRRTYGPKSHGKRRPLGLPTWSDTLLQEGIRSIVDAYEASQCSEHSQGCRPPRGCQTARRDVRQHGRATQWVMEGDLSACGDRIDHAVLAAIRQERVHDHRVLRLLRGLLQAGAGAEGISHATHSGVPQGGGGSPICRNLVLDRLEQSVATPRIPADTRGHRRRTKPPYVRRTVQASEARKHGAGQRARLLRQQAQRLPSRAPHEPHFRRRWDVRAADDGLWGLSGAHCDAVDSQPRRPAVLRAALPLARNADTTLVPPAQDDRATFLGDEVHVRHEHSTHDHRRQRGMHGSSGLRLPTRVRRAKGAKERRRGTPQPLPQRTRDDAERIVAPSQAEWRGLVQSSRMAYTLQRLQGLTHPRAVSWGQTFAKKEKTTCPKISRRYGATIDTADGERPGRRVTSKRAPPQPPLRLHCGGVSLRWNTGVGSHEAPTNPGWSGRSEVVERWRAHTCERCGSHESLERLVVRKRSSGGRRGAVGKVSNRRQLAGGLLYARPGLRGGRVTGIPTIEASALQTMKVSCRLCTT